MEKRTSIILGFILFFLIGLPILFYITLAMSFGSCSGEYYKITNIKSLLLEKENFYTEYYEQSICNFKSVKKIDTTKTVYIAIKFDVDYYTQNYSLHNPSSLNASIEPGFKGTKEKINDIKVELFDYLTEKTIDIKSLIENLKTSEFRKNSSALNTDRIVVYINGNLEGVARIINFNDLQFKFNRIGNNDILNDGLKDDYLIFAINHKAFSKINSYFRLDFIFDFGNQKIKSSINASLEERESNS